MFNLNNKTTHEKIMFLVMRQVEKLLQEMKADGKNLSKIKLKKFQKTHHIDCTCKLCSLAEAKNDPNLRGLKEDGFKVYINEK